MDSRMHGRLVWEASQEAQETMTKDSDGFFELVVEILAEKVAEIEDAELAHFSVYAPEAE